MWSSGDALPLRRLLAAFLVFFSFPALIWSQTEPAGDPDRQGSAEQRTQSGSTEALAVPSGNAQSELQALAHTPLPLTPPPDEYNDNSGYKQTPRMFWVVPNFGAVSANTQLPPLTTHQKFVLATHDTLDYSGFTWTAILAGQALATRSVPELGTGIKGYGRYYWRVFADGVSGTYLTEAIIPSLTHEDPRYYTLGHGGFFRRFGYAVSRTVVTKTDSGRLSFNWSEVGGNLLEAGLSNAYYPAQERGARQTAIDWGQQTESALLNNIAKEFWPDIRHEIRHLILRHD